MHFALVGDSPAALPLARAVAAHPTHRLVAAALTGAITGDVLAAATACCLTDRWESLLVDRSVEGAIVCGTADHLQEAARRIAAEGKPLLIVPHAALATFYYELSLVRDDTRVVLVPAFPLQFAAQIAALRDALARDEIGRVLHLHWEREVAVDSASLPPLLSAEVIDQALLADSDLLRSVGGEYDRVTALRTGVIDSRAAIATVTLAGDGLPEATWTLRAVRRDGPAGDLAAAPLPSPERWTLTVAGSSGQRTLRSDATDGETQRAGVLDAFADSVRGSPRGPAWGDLIRACDVVDAARRSIARRRTIDIHFETTSERSQFKTQMTAIGCGVLVLTLVLVLGLMLVDSAVALPPKLRLVARIAVFVPLFAFLVLQALIVLARPSSAERENT